MMPLYVITLEQAQAEGITSTSLRRVAAWNDQAAKTARRRKNEEAVARHQRQAEALREVAKALAG